MSKQMLELCPLCGRKPHTMLGKKSDDGMQALIIACPTGHVRVACINHDAAVEEWNTRPQCSAVSVAPKPLGFFSQNVDAWGAAEWFDRLAKAIRGRNAAVVAKDNLQFEICNNVASSSASRLVMDFEAQVRATLHTEPQSAPTREEIENIKTAILEDTTALNDTLWMPDHIFKGGSVVDYIDAILSRSQAVIEHGPVAAIVLRAMQSKADPEIYGASHALKINTDRASKAADEIIALTRPMRQDAEKTGEGQ